MFFPVMAARWNQYKPAKSRAALRAGWKFGRGVTKKSRIRKGLPKLQRRSHFDNNQQRGETAEALKTASGQGCPLVYIIGKSEQLLVNKIFA
jgi:hypothetical protein